MTDGKTSLGYPDPKELAADIRSACDLQEEQRVKLAPFVAAGWNHSGDSVVFRELACNRLSATYKNGRFELFFFGLVKTFPFGSAEEALKYINEVEKQLGK